MEPKTKIYLLSARSQVTWDCYSDFVIEAASEERARQLAQERGGDETMGKDWQHPLQFWTNPELASCEELKPDGEEGIWCESFHAG